MFGASRKVLFAADTYLDTHVAAKKEDMAQEEGLELDFDFRVGPGDPWLMQQRQPWGNELLMYLCVSV